MKSSFFAFVFLLFSYLSFAESGGYQVGDRAIDFSLPNIDGSRVSLSDYDDAKGFIVIFTCNPCPYSIAYEDRIIELDKKYKPLGFPVIAINPNDPALQPEDDIEQMRLRAKEKGFTFPYVLDEDQTVYSKYGAARTPHVFLLEKTGSDLIVRYIGAIDDNSHDPSAVRQHYVAVAVDALLEGTTPPITTTKAIGCTIKTKQK